MGSWCKTCGEFMYSNERHVCPHCFRIWEPDAGEAIHYCDIVYACDMEAAVEKWAESSDAKGDYTIIGGSDTFVRVCRDDDYNKVNMKHDIFNVGSIEEREETDRWYGEHLEMKGYKVVGEAIAQYTATEVEDDED